MGQPTDPKVQRFLLRPQYLMQMLYRRILGHLPVEAARTCLHGNIQGSGLRLSIQATHLKLPLSAGWTTGQLFPVYGL